MNALFKYLLSAACVRGVCENLYLPFPFNISRKSVLYIGGEVVPEEIMC